MYPQIGSMLLTRQGCFWDINIKDLYLIMYSATFILTQTANMKRMSRKIVCTVKYGAIRKSCLKIQRNPHFPNVPIYRTNFCFHGIYFPVISSLISWITRFFEPILTTFILTQTAIMKRMSHKIICIIKYGVIWKSCLKIPQNPHFSNVAIYRNSFVCLR